MLDCPILFSLAARVVCIFLLSPPKLPIKKNNQKNPYIPPSRIYSVYLFLMLKWGFNGAHLCGRQIYQTSLRQWNVIIPTILATIIGICKAISSIVVKISFGIHFKRLLIFFSVSMYAANIVSPI